MPGELVVRFRDDVPGEARQGLARSHDAQIVRRLTAPGAPTLVRLDGDASIAEALASFERDPRVLYAEPNFVYRLSATPDDPLFGSLWGLHQTSDRDIDAPEAWEMTRGSKSIVVAVIDSGVAYDHPDLAPNVWLNDDPAGGGDNDGNGKVDDTRGWDFVQNDATPLDYNGHGTHVAGTIGARGNNGMGISGVNWNVSIMPIRAAAADGTLSTAAIVSAIGYACAEGADVVNGSFGGAAFSQVVADAITSPACADVLFVFAAGNDGAELDPQGVANDSYPCELHRAPPQGVTAANVVCVAATDATDTLSGFSNRGDEAVHLAAPGETILSTSPAYSPVAGSDDGFEGTTAQFDARWGARTSTSGDRLWSRWTIAKSGTFSLSDSAGGNYASNSDTSIRRLGSYRLVGRIGCRLEYEMRLDTEPGFDFFRIEGGPTESASLSIDSWSGSTGGEFFPVSSSISRFDGNPFVYIRFRLTSDNVIGGDGVHIDDLSAACLQAGAADYLELDGTSMATPHVSGAAALLLARNPGLTVTELKNTLLAAVDPVPGLGGQVATGGRLNAATMLALVSDTGPPDTTITTSPPALARSTGATFAFSADDPATFECMLDAGAWEPCTSPRQYASLAQGGHVFRVRAIDEATNADPTPAIRSWTVDTIRPNTIITSGPTGTRTARTATFRFRSTESGSKFQCKHMQGPWTACTSGKIYRNLKTGSHTFRVRATDKAGNLDATAATRTWRIR